MKQRCPWAKNDDLYIRYHDLEWGVPVHDDSLLFELLCLEGAQAGLNWLTILKRREAYRVAFDKFNIHKIANYDEHKPGSLMNNQAIIRNRLKIESVINNARLAVELQKEFGSLDNYFWQFVDNKTIKHHFSSVLEVPSFDATAIRLSQDLKRRGFKFIGPTICYAFMQSGGMVNDHLKTCFRY